MRRFAPLMAVLLLGSNYGPTPRQAILNWSPNGRATTIARINVIGNVALARVDGVNVEGGALTTPLLLKHFSFGWQLLASPSSTCDLERLGIASSTVAILSKGMPLLHNAPGCHGPGFIADSGDSADIEAIRRIETANAWIPYVVVVDNYAMAEWYGGGGGEKFFRRGAGGWKLFAGGGGALSARELIARGMPGATACKIMALVDKAMGCR